MYWVICFRMRRLSKSLRKIMNTVRHHHSLKQLRREFICPSLLNICMIKQYVDITAVIVWSVIYYLRKWNNVEMFELWSGSLGWFLIVWIWRISKRQDVLDVYIRQHTIASHTGQTENTSRISVLCQRKIFRIQRKTFKAKTTEIRTVIAELTWTDSDELCRCHLHVTDHCCYTGTKQFHVRSSISSFSVSFFFMCIVGGFEDVALPRRFHIELL